MSTRIPLFLARSCIVRDRAGLTLLDVFVTARSEDGPERIYVAVARTMDFEQITGNAFGYGLKGVDNVSNINMYPPKSIPPNGQTSTALPARHRCAPLMMTDGVNSEGLYVGLLEFPSYTEYPAYNPSDPGLNSAC